MDKAYNEIVFHNDQSPDLDEINMNAISHGLSVVDDRVIQLKGDLTALQNISFPLLDIELSRNRFNNKNITPDTYIENGGQIVPYDDWSTSDFCVVIPSKTYVFVKSTKSELATNLYVGCYDKNKNFLRLVTTGSSSSIPLRSDVFYVRISCISTVFNYKPMLIEIDIQPTVTEYEESEVILLETSIYDDIKSLKNMSDYNHICKSICRIGYKPYDMSTPPEQSIASYKLAYKNGFRIMLCDLQFTSDNVPVLWHDYYLNQHGSQVYKNGSLVDKTLQLNIRDMTYSELNTYDFGHYKGSQYDGTKIMTLNQMCELCKNLGVELYIEIKSLSNSEQGKIACDIVEKYGLKNRTSWAGSVTQLRYVLNSNPSARVGTMPSELDEVAFTNLISLKNDNNKIFFFAWDTTILNDTLVERMSDNNIEFEMGNLDTKESILNYFNKGEAYKYCTGINTGAIIVGKLLLDNYLE